MSSKIQTQFAVREMKIMEDTLNKLGFTFKKQNEQFVISKRYNNIVISANKMTHDSGSTTDVEKIKSEYTKATCIAKLEEEAALYEVTETEQEIIILA